MKKIYILGVFGLIAALGGIVLDTMIGASTGGNLLALAPDALGRFQEFHLNPLLGLYNMDLLNVIVQIMFIPGIYALCCLLKDTSPLAKLGLVIFLVGTAIFITTNSALPLWDLSQKYFATEDSSQKPLLLAAGEAMLARGAHGSPGVFLGFFLPNLGLLLMALSMFKAPGFGRLPALIGSSGLTLLMGYVGLVTFVPKIKAAATIFAMPGGLFMMVWVVIIIVNLLRKVKIENR